MHLPECLLWIIIKRGEFATGQREPLHTRINVIMQCAENT